MEALIVNTEPGKRTYLFNVDLLIEADSNGQALEKLLRILNESDSRDFKINSGITLGALIDKTLSEHPNWEPVPEVKKKEAPRSSKSASEASPPAQDKRPQPEPKNETSDILKRLNEFIAKNTLIRLTILKGKGVKISLPCRIVGYDSASQVVTVYHVDEKKVYQFRLSEIEDFIIT
jgi:hypothetical protein